MLDIDTKRRIDTARDILVGKVPDPKSQVEQITIALIYKFMDDMDREVEELEGKPAFFQKEFAKYSWNKIFDHKISGFELVKMYGEAIDKMNLNPNIPMLFRDIFKNAYLPYRDPETLKSFLKIINEFRYDHSEKLGDAYEYLLSILSSQGDAGQFRTPRHIIDFIVNVVSPHKKDKILDPACGTAGFLISSYKFILKSNTESKSGDKLKPEERTNIIKNLTGYDISPDMVRISLVNMYLHGFSNPKIYEYDTLTSEDRWNEYYDIILANPPFMSPKGGIKPHKRFSIKANRSEVLFVDYICEHLTPTGKAGIIVPEGIIFQSGNAYKDLRKMLVENYLWAVVSLPAGVFNPYSGVKTSILFIDKQISKKTAQILFIKIENDGYDLGAQRREIAQNDLPDALNILNKYKSSLVILDEDKSALVIPAEAGIHNNVLLVEKEKIAKNGDYNLSMDRYRVNEDEKLNNWEMAELGSIAEFLRGPFGSSIKRSVCIPKGDNTFKVYEQGNIIKNDFIRGEYYLDQEKFNELKKFELLPGDVLITCAGTLGKIAVVPKDIEKGIFNSVLMRIRVNKNRIDKIYFVLLFSSPYIQDKIIDRSTGVAIKNMFATSELRKFQIPLPPLSVQQEIVKKIEGYQAIINGARQVVDNYKPQIDIDPDWEMVELGEVCDIISGQSPESEFYNDKTEGMPFYQGRTEFGEIFIGEPKTWTTKITKKAFKNDILMSVRAPVGPVNIATQDICIGRGIAAIRPNEKILQLFLFNFLKTIQEKIKGSGGAIFDSINRNQISELQIPLPKIEIQQQIVNRIEQEQQLVNANKELIKLYEQKIKDEIEKVWEG